MFQCANRSFMSQTLITSINVSLSLSPSLSLSLSLSPSIPPSLSLPPSLSPSLSLSLPLSPSLSLSLPLSLSLSLSLPLPPSLSLSLFPSLSDLHSFNTSLLFCVELRLNCVCICVVKCEQMCETESISFPPHCLSCYHLWKITALYTCEISYCVWWLHSKLVKALSINMMEHCHLATAICLHFGCYSNELMLMGQSRQPCTSMLYSPARALNCDWSPHCRGGVLRLHDYWAGN